MESEERQTRAHMLSTEFGKLALPDEFHHTGGLPETMHRFVSEPKSRTECCIKNLIGTA